MTMKHCIYKFFEQTLCGVLVGLMASPPALLEAQIVVPTQGSPRTPPLAASGAAMNTPPHLSPITNQTINIGQSFFITLSATDSDVPAQTFHFSLLEAPARTRLLTLRSTNTVVSWTPTRDDAGTTNRFTIMVSDSGTPSLSATQSFDVIVTEFVQTTLSTVVVLAGQDACIPIALDATEPITSASFSVLWPPDALTNFSIQPLLPEFCSSNVVAVSPGELRISLVACPGQSLTLTQAVEAASLCFTAVGGQRSTFVPLLISNTVIHTATGAQLTNRFSKLGGVIVVGSTPLLEATISTERERQLFLYAQPGKFYQVESTTDLNEPRAWSSFCRIPMTGPALDVCCLDLTGPRKFFRAYELGIGPTNQPPAVNAGPAQFITTNVTTLQGTASDDGLPAGCKPLTFAWTRVSGPGTAIFLNPTSLVTVVSFSQLGSYLLRLSVSDSQATNSDVVTVTVDRPNSRPLASSQVLTNPVFAALPITLAATDADGDPLIFRIVDAPTNGSLSAAGGPLTGALPHLLYTPSVNNHVADRFSFVVNDGRVDSLPATVTIFATPGCLFSDPGNWLAHLSHPQSSALIPSPVPGSIEFTNCEAILREGDSFLVSLETRLIIPGSPQPSQSSGDGNVLCITYSVPEFDASAIAEMRDAFEVALVDAKGRPLTFTIQGSAGLVPASSSVQPFLPPSPDACFNHSEGQPPFNAPGSMFQQVNDSVTLAIDVTHLAPGTPVRFLLRLINNDRDRATRVRLTDVRFKHAQPGLMLPGSAGNALSREPLGAAPPGPPSFSATATMSGPKVVAGSGSPLPTPTITITAPADDAHLAQGPAMLTGFAQAAQPGTTPTTNSLRLVTVDGQPVQALDPAGNFFAIVDVRPGSNRYEVIAVDALDGSTTNVLTLTGLSSSVAFASQGVVTDSERPEYGRTSFNEWTHTLYADLALRHTGAYSIRAPFYVGVTRISDPSVRLLAPDGVSTDGIPYYDFSATLTNSTLDTGRASLPRTLAFSNPNLTQFRYDLVILGQLNQRPYFTTAPPIEVNSSFVYAYGAKAVDPEGDVLRYALLEAPSGMTIDPTNGLIRWVATNAIGTYDIRLQADDQRGGFAEQSYLLSVVASPSNRPPNFVSAPITVARVSANVTSGPQNVDLSRWRVVQYEFNDQSDAIWVLQSNNTVAVQTVNADASILLSDFDLSNDRMEGTWSVQTAGDDDFIGFVFGFQDTNHFYLFDWKQLGQSDPNFGLAERGMSLKVVSVTPPLVERDVWATHPSDTNRVRLLYHNTTAWEDFKEYTFTLDFRPGEFTIEVRDATNLLASIHQFDATYVHGRFGFYNDSQNNVRYTGFQRTKLPEATYVYHADAIDADGDTLTYAFAGSSQYASRVLEGSPLAYWRLGETSGNTALDSSGGNHSGLYSNVFTLGVPGAPASDSDTAALFAGGFVAVPDTPQLRPTALTVEAWVNAFSVPQWATVVMKTSSSGWQNGFGLAHYTDSDDINFFINSFDSAQVSARLPAGFWSHLVGTYDGATINLYLNGKLAAARSYTQPINHSTQPLRIGSGQGNFPWQGQIDEVAIYDHALSADTIRAHFDEGQNGRFTAPAGMTINPVTGVILWAPTADQIGAHDVTVQVQDGRGGTNFQSYRVCVLPAEGNRSPVIFSLPPDCVIPGQLFTYFINASDPDGDLLTYALNQGPPGMAVNPTNGILQWSAQTNLMGSIVVTVEVSDQRGGAESQTFNLSATAGSGGIRGMVWRDTNTNASRETGETGFPNALVYLDLNDNKLPDPGEPFAYSAATADPARAGTFEFNCLAPGNYIVRQMAPGGFRQTFPTLGTGDGGQVVVVNSGQVVSGVDFGTAPLTNSPLNNSPIFSSVPPTNLLSVGQLYSYTPALRDMDGDLVAYDLVLRPEGMLVETNSGTVAWRPLLSQLGVHDVILRAQDGRGGVALQSWQITVAAPNTPPIITTFPPGPAVAGLPYRYQIRAQDAEGQALSFVLASNAPAGVSLNVQPSALNSALLTWTPTLAQLGTNRIELVVRDTEGAEVRQVFDLEVAASASNRAPRFTSIPRLQTRLAATYAYLVEAFDSDGDPLTFGIVSGPAGMLLTNAQFSNFNSQLLLWTPTPSQLGTNPVTLRVADARGGQAEQQFTLSVASTLNNSAPLIVSLPLLHATAGQPYEYNLAADDPDGDFVNWRLLSGPRGMSLDAATGALRWTPTLDQLGTNAVTVEAQDAFLATAAQSWQIDVGCLNRPPQITSVPPTQAQADDFYLYPLRAQDADGDALAFSFVATNEIPAGMTLSNLVSADMEGITTNLAASGVGGALIRWTPTTNQVGTYVIRVRVSDGRGGAATQTYNLYVADLSANHAPIIVSTPQRGATLGRTYTYALHATDADGDTMTLQSLLPLPAGAAFTPSSGGDAVLSWIPSPAQLGPQEFILAARDPAGASAAQRFFVTVRSNQAPTIVSSPRTPAVPGVTYRYDVNAIDPDGDALAYSFASTTPTGLGIDSFGRIAWIPSQAQIGSFPLTVTASDGFGASATQSFTIIVGADTEPPQVALTLLQGSISPEGGQWAGDLGTVLRVQLDASDNVGVASRALYLGTNPVPLDATFTGAFLVDRAGLFNLTGTALDVAGNTNSTTRTVLFRDPRATNHVFVRLHGPTNNAFVTSPVSVIATITNDIDLISYSWGYALVTDLNLNAVGISDPAFTVVGTSNLPPGFRSLTNFVVGTFDPTLLNNDSYVIAVAATDANGNTRTEPVVVSVQGNLKFGEFRLEFTDLAIPVAGIPIQVKRVYDSRNARRVGDFGYGWSLAIQDATIRKSLSADGNLRPNARVYLTGPAGRRLGFTFTPDPFGGFLGTLWRPRFTPDPGVYETLEVPPDDIAYPEGGGFASIIASLSGPYDPIAFFLTARDGTRYEYDQGRGLQNVTDLSGNRLVYTAGGIFHFQAGSTNDDQSIPFVRDAQGRITQIIGPNGNVLRYSYDGAGDLRAFTDLATNVTSYRYDVSPAHFLTNIVDFLGRDALRAEFAPGGRLEAIYDAQGNALRQAFDLNSNTAIFTDANGNTNLTAYDDRGNETMRGVQGIYTNHFAYDANNNLLASTNGRGFSTNYTYDARGNLTSLIDALSNRTTVAYNALNKPVAVTNALGQTLHLAYDAAGRLLEVIDNHGQRTGVTRDSQGRVTSVTDAAGHTTRMDYTGGCACGRPGKVTNPDGSFRLYEYDSFGQTTREINELGAETLHNYDSAGRLLWIRDPLTNYMQSFYNGPLLTNVVDALGRPTRYEYDALNRTNRIIDAEGGIVEFRYDNNGNRTHVIDPVTNVTVFAYDAANRLKHQVDPLGQTNFFAYDAAGNRTEAVDRNGRRRTFAYDALNRMTNEWWWQGTNAVHSITFEFDALGIQTFAADTNATYRYDYDGLNRLERVTQSTVPGQPDFTLDYTYTALGQVESVSDNWSVRVGSSYDNRNRLASRIWQGPGVDPARLDFAYDEAGNRMRTDRYADLSGTNRVGITTNAYNRTGIVTNITHLGPTNEVLARYDYAFDAAYQLRQWTINNQNSSFDYDRTGQLTNALNTAQPSENFRYDANGNRVGAQSGGGYVTGRNNQILSDGTHAYGYDAEGNMTARTNLATGATTLYAYDHRNRLVSVVDADSGGVVTQTVTFAYDAMNRRLRKSVNGQSHRFLHNQDDAWADLSQSGSVESRYLLGARIDEMLARQRTADGRAWYLTDNLGSVRGLAGADGRFLAQVDFSTFGQVNGASNSAALDRFLFTGREWDEETGLYFYRERYYSPQLGRFIKHDPISFASGDVNLYRYVNNTPLIKSDPTGELAFLELAAYSSIGAGLLTGGLVAIHCYNITGNLETSIEVGFGLGAAVAKSLIIAAIAIDTGTIITAIPAAGSVRPLLKDIRDSVICK